MSASALTPPAPMWMPAQFAYATQGYYPYGHHLYALVSAASAGAASSQQYDHVEQQQQHYCHYRWSLQHQRLQYEYAAFYSAWQQFCQRNHRQQFQPSAPQPHSLPPSPMRGHPPVYSSNLPDDTSQMSGCSNVSSGSSAVFGAPHSFSYVEEHSPLARPGCDERRRLGEYAQRRPKPHADCTEASVQSCTNEDDGDHVASTSQRSVSANASFMRDGAALTQSVDGADCVGTAAAVADEDGDDDDEQRAGGSRRARRRLQKRVWRRRHRERRINLVDSLKSELLELHATLEDAAAHLPPHAQAPASLLVRPEELTRRIEQEHVQQRRPASPRVSLRGMDELEMRERRNLQKRASKERAELMYTAQVDALRSAIKVMRDELSALRQQQQQRQ